MALDYWDYAALGLEPPAERPAQQPAEPAPLGDDRTLFARVNDWMIDTGNAAASLAQAGASLFSPDGAAAKSVGDFIEEGRSNQSDYRKKLRDEQQRLIEEAKAKGDTGALAWITHALSNPITELLPEVVGNLGPFAGAGVLGSAAGAARAAAGGAGAAQAAAAGTRAGLLTTEALGGVVGAGGVRQGYFEDIQRAPDAQLQAENPTYAQLRQSMSEADAKRQLGAEMNPRLAAGMAAGGGVGMLAGRFGAEEAILGRTPGFARIAGAEVGGEFAEGAIQQGAQNFAVQGQLPSKSLWEDVLLSGVQEATVAAPGGVAGGILGRKRAEVQQTVDDLTAITDAPTIEDAVAATQRAIDPALRTAADTPQQTSRMTDEALLSAQARFEQEAAAAQAMMREQAFAASQPPAAAAPPGAIEQRQAELAAQEQAQRDAGMQQMQADQARAAITAPQPEAPATSLATGQETAPAVIQGPMQAAFERAKARLEERRATTVQEPGRTVQGGAPAALAAPGVQAAGPQATVLASPTAPAPPARNTERDGQLGNAPVQLEKRRAADVSASDTAAPSPAQVPAAGDQVGAAPAPEAQGVSGGQQAPPAQRQDLGGLADPVAKLNASLAKERKQRGETSTEPAVVAVDEESLPATRRKNADGTQTLSKHEAQTVRNFASIFKKKVVLFRASDASGRFDGAVVNGDTIYLNADAKSAHHLVVAGHELGHQMRKDAPDLYDQLKRRLSADLKDGNLANFARYYGTSEKDVYARLRSASERDAIVEEFISDLIGNRSAEYKTMLDLFGAAKGSKDAGLIYKVAQFLVDFIDGLIARINRSKFETDALVKDLDKVRREVRGALKEYAVRQNRDDMRARMESFGKPKENVSERQAEEAADAGQEGLLKKSGDRVEYSIKSNKDGTIVVTGDVDAIRSALPEGIMGRKMGDGLAFTVGDSHRVRAALEGRANTYSRGGKVIEKWPVKDGKYVGAPPGFDTPGTIGRWRKMLRSLTNEGAPGRFWYENSSKAILQMTGGDVVEAKKFVATLAIYSPQAKVDANSTFALRAWAQYKAGQPIKVKTGVQDRQATEILYDNKQWGGEKTGNFFNNLLREIDPSTAGNQGATIDMWMMRAGRYPTDAPTKNQYAFMENETNRIARDLGWEPQQVQAAIWVAMKARMENSGVKKRTEASSEKNGWMRYDYPLKDGKPKKTRVVIDAQKHRDNWLDESFKLNVSAEDTNTAKFDFSDGVRRHIGQVSWEARPGRSTGVLPGVNDAPYDQQLEFQQAVSAAFYGPEGEDQLAHRLGLLADDSIFAPGVWQGEVAAGQQNRVAMAPAAGEDGKSNVDPVQHKLLDAYASVIGWLTHQEGVGWHRPFYATAKKDANGLDIDVGRPLTPDEMLATEGAIGRKMEELGVADWQNGLGLISSPVGVRVISFGAVENSVLQNDVMPAIADVLPDHEWRAFASDGNLVTNDWKANPDGQEYVQRVGAEGRSDVLRWAADNLAPRIEKVFADFSEKYGWGEPGRPARDRLGSADGGAQAGDGGGLAASDVRKSTERISRPPVREDGKVELTHWSRQAGLKELDPAKHGTGLSGAESKRKAADPDNWVNRTYYGIAVGQAGGYTKEPGLGANQYTVGVPADKLYDMAADPDKLRPKTVDGWDNPVSVYERKIRDAGYDGYWMSIDGPMGLVAAVYTKQTPEVQEEPALMKSTQRQTDTPAFKKWFGGSVVTNPDGTPKVMYHGTAADISTFKAKQAGAIFVTDKPQFAEGFADSSMDFLVTYEGMFPSKGNDRKKDIAETRKLLRENGYTKSSIDALERDNEIDETDEYRQVIARRVGSGPNLMPLFVKAEKPWDYQNDADVAAIVREIGKPPLRRLLATGEWGMIEDDGIQAAMKKLGYDGFYVKEGGIKNLAVFEPTQLKSAIGNQGTFDGADGDIRRSAARAPSLGALTPAQEAAAKSVLKLGPPLTAKQQIAKLRANLGLRLRQGIVDQFAAIKEIDPRAYMMARMSKASDGALEALMLYGTPFLRDGVLDVKISPDKGFAKVLADLDGEHDRFLLWVAAKRAEKLKKEGRENLFTDADISTLKTLDKGKEAKYAKALADLNRYNDSILKIAQDSGLIDQAAYDLMKDQPYVPFYRVLEDDKMPAGPRFSSGLLNQKAFQKLKGGKDQLNADLLENVLRNWSHMLSASAKNRAAVTSIDAADKLGVAYQVPSGTKGAVKLSRGGMTEHWSIEDPYLMEAVSAVHATTPSWMKPFADMKRALTFGVTVSPTFKIRNLIRDSLSAVAQSDLGYNVAANLKQGFKATAKDSQTYASLLASGGIIRFGTMVEGDGSKRAQALIKHSKANGTWLDAEGWGKLTGMLGAAWSTYQEIGDRTENVNRAALYEQLIKKGYNHADAAFMSRDLMDFSMSGRNEVVRFLAQTVPFLNARLVGLDKLGRSAKQNPARFATMAAAVSAASIALMLAYGDDDDWKKRDDWDRDNSWWFKIGDKAFRIPKPFELGAIGTLAERSLELITDKEMTGKRYRQRLSDMMSQTFSISPIPQVIKPLIDIYANQDSFTGRAIESMAMERMKPEDRYNERTSVAARLIGQLGLPDPLQLTQGRYKALSPVQIDHLTRGYFGWLGTTTMAAVDFGLRPATGAGEKPAMTLRDTFLLGSFVESLPSGSSRYVTQLYEQSREIEQAYASYRDALKRGDLPKAQEIMREDGAKLAKHGMSTAVTKTLSEMATQVKQIEGSRSLSAETKRNMLDAINARRHELARSVSL